MIKHDIEWALGILNGPDGIDEFGYKWSVYDGVVTAFREYSYGEYTVDEAIELAEGIERKKKVAGKHDIEWAVRVLNERGMKGLSHWEADWTGGAVTCREWRGLYCLPAFAAIAIAEKLERDAASDVDSALDAAARSLRAVGRTHAARLVEEVAGASDEAVVLALDELLGDQA